LASAPYCCYLDSEVGRLYIGEAGMIEIFDCINLEMVASMKTLGLVNKIIPLGENSLLIGETNCTLELLNLNDLTLTLYSKNLDLPTNLYFNEKAIIYDLKEVPHLGKQEMTSLLIATDNGLISLKKNLSKKVEHIDIHLEGESIRAIDFVDPATYIGFNRKNQIFIYSTRQREII
jgi:hypothetical protein